MSKSELKYKLLEKLNDAVSCGDLQSAQQAVLDGAPVNTKIGCGQTPVMLAAKYGRSDMIVFLKNKGAKINLYDEDGEHALFYPSRGKANQRDAFDAIKTLLMLGAEKTALNEMGVPLFVCIARSFTPRQLQEISLLGVPLDLDDKNCYGYIGTHDTVLHRFADSKYFKEVAKLDVPAVHYLFEEAVNQGIELNSVNESGLTAWEVAYLVKNEVVLNAIGKMLNNKVSSNYGNSLLAEFVKSGFDENVLTNASPKDLTKLSSTMRFRINQTISSVPCKTNFSDALPIVERAILKQTTDNVHLGMNKPKRRI